MQVAHFNWSPSFDEMLEWCKHFGARAPQPHLGPAEMKKYRSAMQRQIRIKGGILGFVGTVILLLAFKSDLEEESKQFYDPGQRPYSSSWVGSFDSWKQDEACLRGIRPPPYRFLLDDPRTVYFSAMLVGMSSHFVLFTLCVLGCFKRVQMAIDWEKVFTLMVCIIMALMPSIASDRLAVELGLRLNNFDEKCSIAMIDFNAGDQPRHGIVRIAFTMDAAMTGLCLYVPIRPRSAYFIFFISVVSLIGCTWLSLDSDANNQMMFPVFIYVCVSSCVCKCCSSQERCRIREWQAVSNLHETNDLKEAFEKIARIFCDLVIFLDSDFTVKANSRESNSRQSRAFFHAEVEGRRFTELIVSEDVQRFTSIAQCTYDIPGLVSAKLFQRDGCQTVDAELFILRGNSGFTVGISAMKEQHHVVRDTDQSSPEPYCYGRVYDDAKSVGGGPESRSEGAETFAWSTPTGQAFKEVDIGKINEIGAREHWIVDASKVSIDFKAVLGEGGFGIVYTGSYCGSPIAAKFDKHVVYHHPCKEDKKLASVANELRIFRFLRHPNIVLFHGAALVNGQIALIMEKVKGQLLTTFALQSMPMLWRESLVLELVSVIWYMHSQEPPVVHGDVKPSNMMVEVRVSGVGQDLKPHLKLMDFGLSRVLGARPQALGGTRQWRAPELNKQGSSATTSADMFSVGCVIFFILTKKVPFSDPALNAEPLPWPSRGIHPRLELVSQKCVCPHAEQRPSAAQAMHHLS